MKAKLEAGLGAWKPAGSKRPTKPAATPAKLSNRLLLVDRPAAASVITSSTFVQNRAKDGGAIFNRLNSICWRRVGDRPLVLSP